MRVGRVTNAAVTGFACKEGDLRIELYIIKVNNVKWGLQKFGSFFIWSISVRTNVRLVHLLELGWVRFRVRVRVGVR